MKRDDLLERLDEQGLYNKADRIQMIKDAATEIRRLRAATPTAGGDEAAGASLTPQELHAINHARYQVDHATPESPECCFDYELVRDLVSICERYRSAFPSTSLNTAQGE